MIYDTVNNLDKYLGIDKNLDAALQALRQTELCAQMPDGKTEIIPGEVFYTVSTTALKPEESTGWEQHARFADIQLALTEGETIGYTPSLTGWQWAQGADFARHDPAQDDPQAIMLAMQPLCFAVFFPGEPHRPCIGTGSCRKLVVKVKM